jgi:phage-related protein
MKKNYTIIQYAMENGTIPVADFIIGLSEKHQNKIRRTISLLRSFGTDLKEPYVKPMQGEKYKGIWELRIQSGKDASRIFYFADIGGAFVLLNGFIKKTKKTPVRELARAKRYKDDYERRM